MTKLALLLSLCLTGCTFVPNNAPWSGVMDAEDPRTERVLELSRAYTANETDVWLEQFSEDAVVHVNDLDVPIGDLVTALGAGHETFADIAHEDVLCTTMRYNAGPVYTNLWYTWTGTVRSTGEELRIKGYAWFRWEGERIVECYNAFDPTLYNAVAAGSAAELK